MYLAPLNYDRFFKKVFSELRIAKQFLEDFLGVEIEEITEFPVQHKVTDAATQVEFDYRCKIEGHYVIIDMQQWYKPDVVKRFYLYHTLNSALQLESLPYKSLNFGEGKERKIRDYNSLESVITLVWMAEDMLGFSEDYVSYMLTPQLVADFVKNDFLWKNEDIQAILAERTKLLTVLDNKTKEIDFLQSNQLIYLFQKNIVKNHKMTKYFRWFDFAQKTRKENNTKAEFEIYEKDEIFAEMMRRLSKENLPPEDWTYVTNEAEMWERVKRYEEGVLKKGEKIGIEKGVEIGKEIGKEIGVEIGKDLGMQKKEVEFIIRLHSKGKTLAEIAELTDISVERVAEIIAQK